MQYLIDTDWAIHYLRDASAVIERVNALLGAGIGISVIALVELYKGVPGARDPQSAKQHIEQFIARLEIIPLDKAVCEIFANEFLRLKSAGNLIDDYDLLIGATALSRGLTLLTNNRRHFERIEGLSIVSVDKPTSS